jgi:hypothetical protein
MGGVISYLPFGGLFHSRLFFRESKLVSCFPTLFGSGYIRSNSLFGIQRLLTQWYNTPLRIVAVVFSRKYFRSMYWWMVMVVKLREGLICPLPGELKGNISPFVSSSLRRCRTLCNSLWLLKIPNILLLFLCITLLLSL